MSWGGPAKALAFALVMMSTALVALAAPAGTPQTAAIPGPTDPAAVPTGSIDPTGPGGPVDATVQGFLADPALPPTGQPRVRTDKNCYLPGQAVTITLKNVGGGTLLYDSLPDYEIENDTIGAVRMIERFQPGRFRFEPGASMSWVWDQKWLAWDAEGRQINKGMFVPRGEYFVNIWAQIGFPIPDTNLIARAKFSIGECMAQINAGDDIVATEGQAFQFHPVIQITGDAVVRSVTWDLDPAVDSNGDGNFTNDIDLAGTNPSYAFGDDGIYTVTMNLKGFGTVSGMDRTPQDTVFAIDSSDSMAWKDPLDHRKIAVKDYVDWLVPDDRGAVVDFDSVARLVGGDHLGMDYARIKANVDTIDASGDLFLSAGLFVSLYELRDYGDGNHKWLIIFITGAETENPRDPFYIPRAIEFAKDLGVTIYTVGLNVDAEMASTMRHIASETGGKYFPAATATNLRKIYEDIASEVNQSQGQFFTVSDALTVTVDNVPPAVALDASVPVNVSLRVAGERWHDVNLTLFKDGEELARASVTRTPGSPDNQSVSLGTIEFELASTYEARVEYTPLDDLVNGGENGANPAWIILGLANGTELWFEHTFNVQHPDTWVWDVPDLEGLFTGRSVALSATIADPGSDDATVAWDWGDGTIDTRTVFNDGVGPDPYPSPWGLPVAFTDLGAHTYAAAGSYAVTLTVSDDDGGTTVLSFTVTVG